jgi:hypothetical protein
MTIKLHLFSGFENRSLGVYAHMALGHLYSSDNSRDELLAAGKALGLKEEWLQNSHGFLHFDLWNKPLRVAKDIWEIVDDLTFYEDMKTGAGKFTGVSLKIEGGVLKGE